MSKLKWYVKNPFASDKRVKKAFSENKKLRAEVHTLKIKLIARTKSMKTRKMRQRI